MKKMFLSIILFIIYTCANADQGLTTFTTTLATANVRQTVSGSTLRAETIIIQNPASNIVSVFVGGSDVTTSGIAVGLEVAPGEILRLGTALRRGDNESFITTKIFMVSTGTAIPITVGVTTDRK